MTYTMAEGGITYTKESYQELLRCAYSDEQIIDFVGFTNRAWNDYSFLIRVYDRRKGGVKDVICKVTGERYFVEERDKLIIIVDRKILGAKDYSTCRWTNDVIIAKACLAEARYWEYDDARQKMNQLCERLNKLDAIERGELK